MAVPKVDSSPVKAEIGVWSRLKVGVRGLCHTDERTQDNISREGHQHKFPSWRERCQNIVLFPAQLIMSGQNMSRHRGELNARTRCCTRLRTGRHRDSR